MKAFHFIASFFGVGLVWLAFQLDSPYLLNYRGLFYLGLPALLLGAYYLFARFEELRATGQSVAARVAVVPAVLVAAALVIAVTIEENRTRQKERVRRAEPELVRELGRHIVLGYDPGAPGLEEHLRRRGVSGVFVTGRNVNGRSAEDIARELAGFQSRGATPARPLLISADQEGGPVSRLSPPLEYLPPLQEKVDPQAMLATEARVRAYARRQTEGLGRLGVNVNFAPVVDLKKSYDNLLDFHTKIADRALHSSPEVVSRAARAYAEELRAGGVLPTLKHFPGLGRVRDDTHHFSAAVDARPAELEATDWLPFRAVASATGAMIMLGHVRVSALDDRFAASQSEPVVQFLRRDWNLPHGLFITDDMCMNPVVQSPGGIGGSAVRALNAGVDLLLVTYHPERYYEVMDALIQAWAAGELNRARLRESAGRIDAARAWLGAARMERRVAARTAGGQP